MLDHPPDQDLLRPLFAHTGQLEVDRGEHDRLGVVKPKIHVVKDAPDGFGEPRLRYRAGAQIDAADAERGEALERLSVRTGFGNRECLCGPGTRGRPRRSLW